MGVLGSNTATTDEKLKAIGDISEGYLGVLEKFNNLPPEQRQRFLQTLSQDSKFKEHLNQLKEWNDWSEKNPGKTHPDFEKLGKHVSILTVWNDVKSAANHADVFLYFLGVGDVTLKGGSTPQNLKLDKTDLKYFSQGSTISVNGEERKVVGVDPKTNSLILDKPLSQAPGPGTLIELKPDAVDYGLKLIETGLSVSAAHQSLKNTIDVLAPLAKKAAEHSQNVLKAAGNTRLAKNTELVIDTLKELFDQLIDGAGTKFMDALRRYPNLLEKMVDLTKILGKVGGGVEGFVKQLKNIGSLVASKGKAALQATMDALKNSKIGRAIGKLESKIPVAGALTAAGLLALDVSSLIDNLDKGDSFAVSNDIVSIVGDVTSVLPGYGTAVSLCCDAWNLGTAAGGAIASYFEEEIDTAVEFYVNWIYSNTAEHRANENEYRTAWTQEGIIGLAEFDIRNSSDGTNADWYDDDDEFDLNRINERIKLDQRINRISKSEAMVLRMSAKINQWGSYVGKADWDEKKAAYQQVLQDYRSGEITQAEKLLLIKGIGGQPYVDYGILWDSNEQRDPPTNSQIRRARNRLAAQVDRETNPVKKLLLKEKLGKVDFWIKNGPPGPDSFYVNYD